MYWETGVSFRFGEFRKMFSSSTDAIRDVNKYKTFSNIYHSIYGYEETEEKYDIITGKFKRIGPNYESAIINRIVLDLDSWNKDDGKEIYTEDGLESMRKMEDWGEKKNLLREYRFSGGGFYFIFGAVGHPLKLRDYEINLRNILRVTIDEATIGDTARMMRVTNSFNFKENRLCHCIPLTQDELCLSFNQIKELAEKTRFHKRFVYGENIENFNNCKMDKSKIKLKSFKINLKQNIDVDNLLSNYGWEVNDFCDTFKGILSKKHIGNYLRYEFIKYLKSIVSVSLDDAIRILVGLLKGEGRHSAIEGQAKNIYGRDMVFNPKKLKGLGYCPEKCEKCLQWRFFEIGD